MASTTMDQRIMSIEHVSFTGFKSDMQNKKKNTCYSFNFK